MAKENKKKILLIALDRCPELEEPLTRAKYRVVRTNAGGTAVQRARHDSFSAAVLISTGQEMDLSETALNLHDVAPSLEIVILMDRAPDDEMTAQAEAIVRAIPKSRILRQREFSEYLASLKETGDQVIP